jgi:PPOX class probable F420-dependent enzyme
VPKPPVPDVVSEFLSKPNPAVIATVRPDGEPVSVATWYIWENGQLLVNMDESRKRLDHLRNEPHVSLPVLDGENWYTHVSLQGRVTRLVDDPDLTDIDRLSTHYGGNPYPVRDQKRISAWIEVDRWHGWGALKDAR